MTQIELANIGAVVAEAARINAKFYGGDKYFFFFSINEEGRASGRLYDREKGETVQRTYEVDIIKEPESIAKILGSMCWVEGYADGINAGAESRQAEIDALKREVEELRLAAKVLTSGNGEADNKPEVEF